MGTRGAGVPLVAVVGVGLMGASLGLALRERAGADEVLGVDPDPESRAGALARGAITREASLGEAAAAAQVIVLAAPVGALPGLAAEAVAASGEGTLVTDLGSTKGGLMAALAPVARERFIGGHPVCGGETSGPEAARADLFEGATWFLTPAPEARPDLYERLHRLVAAVGALPTAIAPEVHDRLMAIVSHLPHVIAATLVNQAAETAPEGREALRSAGPSFRDLTRVAGANPELWADIMLDNRAALVAEVDAQSRRLHELADALRAEDRPALVDALVRAREANARLRAGADPRGDLERIEVGVPDRPGALSAIATALGHADVNIADLTLLPGPPGGVGTLELMVAAADAGRAVALLSERGYAAAAAPAPERLP